MNRLCTNAILLASTLVLTSGLAVGHTSTGTQGLTTERTQASQDDPRTETLARLSRRFETEFVDQRAQDVFEFIAQVTGADLLVTYESDTDPEGIDPEALISLKVRNQPALTVLDRLIRTLNTQLTPSTPFTWQMSEDGAYQLGPRDALDRETRTVIYDIGDLLFEIPNFDNAPDFELQSSSGSGGTQSPFQGGGGDDEERLTTQERTDNLVNVITTIVEPDAWVSLGGSSATITAYQTTLIVSAPDYVHRALGGYDFWPSALQSKRFEDGRLETTVRPKRTPKGP
ncbi:MAG: hypothetical protein ACI89L_000303 [Phycisphaerales bacterium]